MAVNRIENNSSQGKFVRTSIAGGFIAGGAAGYLKSVINKNGEPTDSFIKEISYSIKNEDNKHIIKTGEILDALDNLPDEELHPAELAQASSAGINPAETASKKAAYAKEEIIDFITMHSEEIGIIPQENQTLEEAVENFIGSKNVKEIKDAVEKEMSDQIINRPTMDYDELAKDYFNNVYDKTAKKYKSVSDELPKEQIEFIKKAARNTKLKTGAIYGIVTAAAAGVLTFISTSLTKKKSNL